MRITSLSFKFNVFLVFYLKFLSCLELAKHNIFVLTVDCSLKKKKMAEEDFKLNLSFGDLVSFRVYCRGNAVLVLSSVLKVAPVPGLQYLLSLPIPCLLSASAWGCLCELLSLTWL